MHTVMTTNNAYDTILLVNNNDTVIGHWTASKEVIADYIATGNQAEAWDANGVEDSFDGSPCDKISHYGVECGRDGKMTESRREFWV